MLLITLLLLVACNTNTDSRMTPATGVTEHIEEGARGIGFGVTPYDFEWDWDNDVFFDGSLLLNESSDVLVARVENISASDHNFVLKIFLNYETVPFRVLDEEAFAPAFLFSLTSGYQLEIPFVLDIEMPDENEMFKLTAAVFSDPEYHVVNMDAFDQYLLGGMGTVLNFDLYFGERQDIHLDVQSHVALAQRENEGFASLRINTQLDVADFHQRGYSQPMRLVGSVLQVSPGEVIDLAFFANLYVERRMVVEEYVILALLDWEQVELNGLPYLLMQVEDHDFDELVEYGHFTIVAPDEVGLYEFVAMIIPNPREINTFDHYRPIELSDRFTIEVVE